MAVSLAVLRDTAVAAYSFWTPSQPEKNVWRSILHQRTLDLGKKHSLRGVTPNSQQNKHFIVRTFMNLTTIYEKYKRLFIKSYKTTQKAK